MKTAGVEDVKYDYEKHDTQWAFKYRDDKLEVANALGYKYITEMYHKLYLKHGSLTIAGEKIGVTNESVKMVLVKMGVKIKPRGGMVASKISMGIAGRLKGGFKPGMVKRHYAEQFKADNGLNVTLSCLEKVLRGATWVNA